ncbi:MAG: hypothetical protein H7334_01370 [Ferruginibacter sp.]|nr:hypothetical protein [Ferruginibacter sp.]
MRKFLLGAICLSYLLSASGCFIFKGKDKYGCPSNGRNVGAEKLLGDDDKAVKASSKLKYKGGRKSF